MKKILFSALVITSGMGLFAQSALQKQSERLSKISTLKTEAIAEYPQTFEGESPLPSTLKAPDVVIGGTRFDLQSNSSMGTRIYAFPDGTMNAVWTKGETDAGTFPDRGTGYNYYNGSAWGPAPTARIEPRRVGWPSIQPYGENGEIVVTHTGGTDGLLFSHRPQKGTGTWSNFYLTGPVGHEDLLWPRMVTTGENHEIIHIIAIAPSVANGGTVYQGLDGALLYSRSFDGGVTWNPLNEILPGTTADDFYGFGGDEYSFADPVGETIAFAAGGFITDGVVVKSTDNGDTWDSYKYYIAPAPRFNNEFPIPQHGGIDAYQSVVIDDNGMTHVAVGRMCQSADGNEGSPTSFYGYTNGLLYWNETMAPMDSTSVGFDILDVSGVPSQYLLAEVQEHGEDTIIGLANYQASLTSMPQLAFDHTNKLLYAFYSGLSLGFATEDFNYRHIWYRFSDDYGQTWSPYTDLTSDVFHIFSECVFVSVAGGINDKVHAIYQSSSSPGINQRYEVHGIIDNTIVYLSVNASVGVNETPANILSLEQINPNPANTIANVILNVDKAVDVEVSLVNMLGQEVYTSSAQLNYAGAHNIKLDISSFETGIYFVKVKAGNSIVTKKLMID
jgi:hypothetical protein